MNIWTIVYYLIIVPFQMVFRITFGLCNNVFNSGVLGIIFSAILIAEICIWLNAKGKNGNTACMVYRTVTLLAAYLFFTNLESLNGTTFWKFYNMAEPDRLIWVGDNTVNVFPFLMAAIGVVVALLSVKKPISYRVYTFILEAASFLFLYNRPSGLIFLRIVINIILLMDVTLDCCSNIGSRKNNKIGSSLRPLIKCGIMMYLLICVPINTNRFSITKVGIFTVIVFLIVLILLNIIKIARLYRTIGFAVKLEKFVEEAVILNDRKYFAIIALAGSLLFGALIPTSVMVASPQDFIRDILETPLVLLLRILLIWVGCGIVCYIIYLFSNRIEQGILMILGFLSLLMALINFSFFARKLGNMSTELHYDNPPEYSLLQIIINLVVLLIVFGVLLYLFKKAEVVRTITIIIMLYVTIMSATNYYIMIDSSLKSDLQRADTVEPIIKLSKNGKNVVMLMLDRAVGAYFPIIMNEVPELCDVFSGFTYYPNTVSFAGHTNLAAPALWGGYEYTPYEINRRDSEALVDKHNEALKVVPEIFADNGFEVVVCDPPYAGYEIIPKLSIYDDIREDSIETYVTQGMYINTIDSEILEGFESAHIHNFMAYSIMKSLPLLWQNSIYDNTRYLYYDRDVNNETAFLDSFSVLHNLSKLTEINEETTNNVLMLDNETPHSACALDMPDYVPKSKYDRSAYENLERFVGFKAKIENERSIDQYCTNISAIKQVSNWLQYLKDNGVYDNTRIIIAADHGIGRGDIPEMLLDGSIDCEAYNPLLLVKDFNAEGEIATSDEFMTNAEVPLLMMENVIDNPINPYTKKVMSSKKYEDVLITTSHNYNIYVNNGNVFDTSDGKWITVHDDIYRKSNWEDAVKTE